MYQSDFLNYYNSIFYLTAKQANLHLPALQKFENIYGRV